MSRRNRFLIAFAVLAIVQLAVPASRLILREITLRKGTMYRFRTMAVDPYDAFRGRYVAVRTMADSAPLADGVTPPNPGERVYVTVDEDGEGFARLTDVSATRPEGEDYIKAIAGGAFSNRVYVVLPLDRFYMNERLAPRAEAAYMQQSRERETWLAVRVRKGWAVIEDLYIGDQTIVDFLRNEQRN